MPATQTEAIKRMLTAYTWPDLAALYNEGMEVQVEAATDSGEIVEGTAEKDGKVITWRGWTDGVETWKSLRIPYNASTSPTYEERDLGWNIARHAQGIGLTGWDFKNKVSKWVGFDFDAMIGHSQSHDKRLSDDDLYRIERLVSEVPWVTVRRSTGGKGLHIYVMLNDVPTANHTEHAALARAVLGLLSAETGHPLHTAVDVCGHVLWVWHRKMLPALHITPRGINLAEFSPDIQNLKLVKQGGILYTIPANWREHLQVVTGTRKRIMPNWVKDENRSGLDKLFEELSGQHSRIRLEEQHVALMQWLKENEEPGFQSWFDPDNHMFVTHTTTLARAHTALGLRGVFRTSSSASSSHNCFMYPLKLGAWAVRRYSLGVHEADTWTQDGNGWTRCYYNRDPDLRTAAVAHNGVEKKDGSYQFTSAEQAASALEMLGTSMQLHPRFSDREAQLALLKDGRIHVQFKEEAKDKSEDLNGWLREKGYWKRIFSTRRPPDDGVSDTSTSCAEEVRHLVADGQNAAWAIKTTSWNIEPIDHVRIRLAGMGLKGNDLMSALDACISRPWTMVSRPFEPEYPGEREWNRGAAQFKHPPSLPTDELFFPTWRKVLGHCGAGLDIAIKENKWCITHGVTTGEQYLTLWIAAMFQRPAEPLPYLFFYGEQSCGKTTFHEAIEAILTSGVVKAHIALLSQSQFNGEMSRAILAVVEEINLAATPLIHNKVKELISAKTMLLHKKGKDACPIINTLHWVQCGNDPSYVACPTGDTRINVIKVENLKPEQRVERRELLRLIEREAPDFVRHCLDLVIPSSNERLTLPIIETYAKKEVQRSNMNLVEQFIDEQCGESIGNKVLYSDMWTAFQAWVPTQHRLSWTQQLMGKSLPLHHAKGRDKRSNQFYVTNLSLDPKAKRDFGVKLTVKEGFICYDE